MTTWTGSGSAANVWGSQPLVTAGFWDGTTPSATATATATATASVTASVSTKIFSLNATLLAPFHNTTTSSFDSILNRLVTGTATLSLSGMLRKAVTKTGNLDAFLLGPTQQLLTAGLDARLTGSAVLTTKTLNLSGTLQKTIPSTASLGGLLRKTVTKTSGLDGRLIGPPTTFTQQTSLNAVLQAPPPRVVFLDAQLAGQVLAVSGDAYILYAATIANDDIVDGGVIGTERIIQTGDLVKNDYSLDDHSFSVTSVFSPVGCSATLSGTTVTVVPSVTGTATFLYNILDDRSLTGVAKVFLVNIIPSPPTAPIAVNDTITATATIGQVLTIDDDLLLANDSSPDGRPFSAVSVASTFNCTAFLQGTAFLVTPSGTGTSTFDYIIADDRPLYDTARVTLTAQSASVTSSSSAAWILPVAVADTFSGGASVNYPFLVNPADQLLDNDTFDPRGSISLIDVGSASAVNCTVSLASNILTITPLAVSPVNFRYSIEDNLFFRSSATVTLTAVQSATSSATKSIYMYHPATTTFKTDILPHYNGAATYIVYQDIFDSNPADGTVDWAVGSPPTTKFVNKMNSIPSTWTGPVALDWEGNSFLHGLSGRSGTARQTQNITQALRLLSACNSYRPNVKWGFYWLPFNNSESAPDTKSQWWVDQYKTLSAVWKECGAVMPDIYQRFQINASGTSTTSYEISNTTDQRRMSALATLSLQCGETGGNLPVYPFVADVYYSNSNNPLNTQAMADQEMYTHVKNFCAITLNGRQASGLYWWGGGTAADATEADLKTLYQAVNALSFNSAMPRP